MGAVDGSRARGEDGGMRVVFVDESGDVGGIGSPTRHFVLVALVVEHISWPAVNAELRAMRERLHRSLGLRPDAEIHASEFLGGSESHLGLGVRSRFLAAHHILRTVEKLPGVRVVKFAVRKDGGGAAILDTAWMGLLRQVAGLPKPESPTSCPSRGLVIICDHHSRLPYRPSRTMLDELAASEELLELPFGRDSADSLVLQAADLMAYLAKQAIEPNSHFSKARGRTLLRQWERLMERMT